MTVKKTGGEVNPGPDLDLAGSRSPKIGARLPEAEGAGDEAGRRPESGAAGAEAAGRRGRRSAGGTTGRG